MRILFVDDELSSRELLADFLKKKLGHQVTQCSSGAEAFRSFRDNAFPMVLSDIRMPGMDGIELLEKIKSLPEGKTADVVLLTGYGNMGTAIKALRAGAYDYLLKPTKLLEVEAVVARIAEHQALIRENYVLTNQFDQKIAEATRETQSELRELKKTIAQIMGVGKICIVSDAMKHVLSIAERLHEDRAVPVLIEGETGTGKEVIAKLIHFGRKEVTTSPFICINCSAISPTLFETELFGYEAGAFSGAKSSGQKGKLELAQGGTLFLDEIGDVPLEMQPKLLRVLQEHEFYRVGGLKKIKLDVHIVCATNRDLVRMIKDKSFREDLYYRLNTGSIYIPPLRERREDIVPLAKMFLEDYTSLKKRHLQFFSDDALKLLINYGWPGNVRQLQNAIERVVLLHDGNELDPGHFAFLTSTNKEACLPPASPDTGNTITIELPSKKKNFPLSEIESIVVRKVLSVFDGNKSQAARYLQIAYNTLRSKLDNSN